MVEWVIITILYICGSLLYGVAFYEERRDMKTRGDFLGLVFWPIIPLGALSLVAWRRLTTKEADRDSN